LAGMRARTFVIETDWSLVAQVRRSRKNMRVVMVVCGVAVVIVFLVAIAVPVLAIINLVPAFLLWDLDKARANLKPMGGLPTDGDGLVRADGGTLVVEHPLLPDPVVLEAAEILCFDVQVDPPVPGTPSYSLFPVRRRVGFGYRTGEPLYAVSTDGRNDIQLVCPDLGNELASVVLLLCSPRPVRVVGYGPALRAAGAPDASWPFRKLRRPGYQGRDSMRNLTRTLVVTTQEVDAPGFYLRIADPVGFAATLTAMNVRQGIDADDVPGAPQHLPLPPPNTR